MLEENLQVSILEKQILRCLFEHNELLDKTEIDCFVSPQAQEFYCDLFELKNNGKQITAENILTLNNQFLNSDLVLAVQDTNYDINEFSDYVQKLSVKSVIHDFKSDVLSDLNENESDYEKLESISKRIDSIRNKTENKNEATTFQDLIKEHKEEIIKRSKGIRTTSGDYNLDKLIGGYQAGIGLILGMSGSMKSTFIIKILRNRITKRLPTVAFNTELTHATYMDTLTSTMIDENYKDMIGDGGEDEFVDWDNILNKLDELEKRYARLDKSMFKFYPRNTVSINNIRSFCKKCRKDFGLKKDDILFCTIDLLLMIADMNKSGMSRADAITQGINLLNDISLEDNIFFLCTVQARRLQNSISIEKLEDLDKYRCTLERLKESGSLEERSRIVLSLHNPHYLVNRTPCSQMIRDLVDPILELTVLKNSWVDNLGQTIYYYIDSEHKDLIDYVPQNGEIPNSNYSQTNDNEDVVSKLEKELEDD